MPPVLLTRPRAASDALALRLRAAGARVVLSPLLAIRHADALPPLAPALIFTSANGVEAYAALGGTGGRPTWCVGPGTAEAARAAGLDVRGWAADAAALARAIPADAPPLLHLRGAVQRGDLVGALRARGLAAEGAAIYRQDLVPLGSAARRALADAAIVPLYSPRTAAAFARACPPDAWPRLTLLSLSAAVAAALPRPSRVAETPDGAAMWRMLSEALHLSAVEGRPETD